MSKYISFIKLKHLIFLNGGSMLDCFAKNKGSHYSRKLLCRRPEAVGLGLECRRLSLTRRLFPDAVGLGAVGVIGRRVRAKYRRVRLCRRLRLTRRPRNAVGSGHFQLFLKNSKFEKKITN